MTTIRKRGPDPERRRRAAVHLLLPPRRLHPRARPRLRARAVRRGEGRDRADPHQLAHVRRGPPADLPGHRHRQRVPRRSAWTCASIFPIRWKTRSTKACAAPTCDPDNKLRASVLDESDFGRKNTKDNTPGGDQRAAGAGRQGRSRRRRQGRRLGGEGEVRDAQPFRLDRRLGAEDRADHGRRLVPAGHARHRRRRHRREGDADGQGIADGADRHGRAQGARPEEQGRGAAHRALRQGERARHRRAGPRRPVDRARRQDPHLPGARREPAGRDDPELRGDAARALRARRLGPGGVRGAEALRLAGGDLEARRQLQARGSGQADARKKSRRGSRASACCCPASC